MCFLCTVKTHDVGEIPNQGKGKDRSPLPPDKGILIPTDMRGDPWTFHVVGVH